MKDFFSKLGNFLNQSTIWIYCTLFLFLSYLMMISLGPNNWTNYGLGFTIFLILFFPALLFSGFRKVLTHNALLKWSIWFFCFILYPILLGFLAEDWIRYLFESISNLDFSIKNIQEFFFTMSIAVLATEVGILLSNDWIKNIQKRFRLIKFDLEKTLIALILLLSFFIAGINVSFNWIDNNLTFNLSNTVSSIFQLLNYTFQCFLIGLGHYLFYYLNHYFLIPKIMKPKGLMYYGFGVAAMILIIYPAVIGLIQWLPMPTELGWEAWAVNVHGANSGGLPFAIMILTVPVIISNQWFKQANAIANLEKEKSDTELTLLKQQINPHFFFNTLNNLYALSLTKDEQTPEVILQLSDLMRYVIYRGKEKTVPIEEELQYLQDYIQLQQIRLHKKMDLTFDISIPQNQIAVPPLLFVVLVENAFKHGIEPAENKSYLQLKVETLDDSTLKFTCNNSVEEYSQKESGIGLENLKRRLALIYSGKEELKIKKLKNSFEVELKIPTF